MKVYILYGLYYDFCDQWPSLLGVYSTEEKAIFAQIQEESKEKYKNTEQYSTDIDEHEVW